MIQHHGTEAANLLGNVWAVERRAQAGQVLCPKRGDDAILGKMPAQGVYRLGACLTSRSRVLKAMPEACFSEDLTATKRMVGRSAASAIASASTISFFCRLTNGFT